MRAEVREATVNSMRITYCCLGEMGRARGTYGEGKKRIQDFGGES
jgi:hypothetical protein